MPTPEEAPPGSPLDPVPRVPGRFPHGFRPIIPLDEPTSPHGGVPPSPPPVEPAALAGPPEQPVIQPPPDMLATGLLPLQWAGPQPPSLPEATPPAPPVLETGRLSTGLLPAVGLAAVPPAPAPTPIAEPASPPTVAPAPPSSPVAALPAVAAPVPAAPPSPGTATVPLTADHPPKRHHHVNEEEEKAAQLGLRQAAPSAIPAGRPANQRRSTHLLKLFGLLLFIMVACFAGFAALLYHFYQQDVEPRLASGSPVISVPLPAASDPAVAKVSDLVTRLQSQVDDLRTRQNTTAAKVKALELPPFKTEADGSSTQLSLADGHLSHLQEQINALRTQQSQADVQLKKLETPAPPKPEDDKTATQLAAALKEIKELQARADGIATGQTQLEDKLKPLLEKAAAPPPPPQAEHPQIGTVVAVTTDTNQELRILKERNRLTLFADQAMAYASSQAMAGLWAATRDPDLAFVKDGAVAEIIRVQHFFATMPGLPASYRLPLADLFKDAKPASEADLKTPQVIPLLLDQAQPPEIRTRSALLLTGRKERAAGDALVNAMRHDPSLLVVKAAQNALQNTFELYGPRLFDTVGMEKAWRDWQSKNPEPETTEGTKKEDK